MKRQAVEVAPSGAKSSRTSSHAPGLNGTKPHDRVWRRFALAYLGRVRRHRRSSSMSSSSWSIPMTADGFSSLGLRGLFDGLQRSGQCRRPIPAAARPPTRRAFGDTDTSQRTGNVALGRSARFNAAIFGNSHGQLLSPQRLSQATGLNFVQLTVPGANVREQLAMMGWFMRHHRRGRRAGPRARRAVVRHRPRPAAALAVSVLALQRQQPRLSRQRLEHTHAARQLPPGRVRCPPDRPRSMPPAIPTTRPARRGASSPASRRRRKDFPRATTGRFGASPIFPD